MIVKPYADRVRRTQPLALFDHEGVAWDESGEVVNTSNHATYIDRDTARWLIANGKGAGIFWRDRLIEWVPPTGSPVRVLPHDGASSVPFSDRLAGLILWGDWLASYGVSVASPQQNRPPASVGSAAMRLLRASLRQTLFCSAPESECPPIRSVIGGRQECRQPGTYKGTFTLWDMKAAYASTIATTPYGGWWRHLGRDSARRMNWEGVIKAGTPSFIRAQVRFTSLTDIGPLPKRPQGRKDYIMSNLDPAWFPKDGTLQGTWAASELMAARVAGVDIRILDGWKMYVDSRQLPFARWWDRVNEGRELGGYAGSLAKITGNSLVGQFHIDNAKGNKRRVWMDGNRKRQRYVKLPGGVRPAFDLAEYITGTVRGRLLSEALWPFGDRVIAAHTDSVWVDGESNPPGPGWRLDDRAEVMDILDAQHLAYRRPNDPVTRYKMAGIPHERAEIIMDELWRMHFGQGGPQRQTKPYDHIPERDREYHRLMERLGAI